MADQRSDCLSAGSLRLPLEEPALELAREMDRFLAGVEQSAFRIARYHLGDADEALDVVQDAMISLVRSYARRSPEDWKPLFFKILQNRVRDMQRKRSVRARVMGFLPGGFRDDIAEVDPIQQAPDTDAPDPGKQLALDDAMAGLEHAVSELPPRQREAFLLRTLESLSVEETATAMGCSEGSVKTHYSRAVHKLRAELGEHWDATD
ncbi:MAG: RNA polymerase sigma factor [Gammaproteobacteria bacterium]|nr:RNA polymerase sigma factor [Gammaproteobacteria bacterium]